MIDLESPRGRARIFGWISLAFSPAALCLAVSSHRDLQMWKLSLSAGLAVMGMVVGVLGVDARRACEHPKPYAPIAGVWFSSVIAAGVGVLAALAADVRLD